METQRLPLSPHPFNLRAAAVTFVFALALPACGGDGGGGSASEASGGRGATDASSATSSSSGGSAGAGGSIGSGGGAGGEAETSSPGSGGGTASAPVCADGTIASYLGSSCSQGDTVYHWSTYACTSTPASLCAALGVNGANFNMRMDPNGAHTILVGATTLMQVTAGQRLDVVITGTVHGSALNLNWPHFSQMMHQPMNGQTGDGTEENITTVGCAASGNCLDANNGVSDILCSKSSPPANCTDQMGDGIYNVYKAKYNPAPASHPYSLTIEIELRGNSGTAELHSVGTHL